MLSLGNKKLAIFIAVLVTLGCGFAPMAHAVDADKKAETGGAAKPGDPKVQNHYIKIPALILPIIGDNGVEQIVSVMVVIEASSDDTVASINQVVPRINDAYLTDLYGSLDRREHMKNGLLDLAYVKQQLTDIALKITGPDKVKNVLIQAVSQHQA